MKKNLWILASVIVLIGISTFLLNRQPANDEDVTNIELPANSSEEYDVFSDPNVLWGNEGDILLPDMVFPGGSILFGPKLIDLMADADASNIVAFSVKLMHLCEFQPVDINSLLIPDSLVDDDYLLEYICLFNKADNLNRCTDLYNEARMYVEDAVSTEDYLSYYYSWKYSDAKWARSRFIEFGFIPVYGEEFTDQGQESIDKLLTFVGAPKDIKSLEEKVTKDEVYLLRATNMDSSKLLG